MIVYAEHEESVSTRELIREIASAGALERLIRLGQLEAGIVDFLCPELDDCHPVADSLRTIAFGDAPVETLNSLPLPEQITTRPPEGYAFYSLYPLQYERAAQRFVCERRPGGCVVLGIRSIGTSLSAVVARTLRRSGVRVASWTVRPHGHPFDRQLHLSDRMREELRRRSADWFCIVDEGPGISGSSFASVAEALSRIGVPDDRIVMFPSYEPHVDGLASETARRHWRRHPVYCDRFPQETVIPAGARDMSGGLWRDIVGRWPAVQPQHERRKYLHEGKLWKFAGLAHLGSSRFKRGQVLSDAGFIPRVHDFRDGFIASEFVNVAHTPFAGLLDVIARYLVFLRREFATRQPVRYGELVEMIRVNAGIELPHRNTVIEDAVVVQVDGRMLPHEWAGTLKTDALDHYDDHFFPGCQDIAWDIAGAAIEFGVPDDSIADRYLAIQHDRTLKSRLPFYKTAYLSYRIGYTHMAAESLGDSDDGRRFAEARDSYTTALLGTARPISSIA